MDFKIGFIGAGNMGSAMVNRIAKSGLVPGDRIFIYDVDKTKLEAIRDNAGINIAASNEELVEKSDIIILAVKPNMAKKVLEDCKSKFDASKVLVSIVLGLPINFFKRIIGEDKMIVRTMPNTPALIGEGMILMSYEKRVDENKLNAVKQMLECMGKVETLEEKLMNEVTALTGSSPAYVYIFIEAMADAAVQSGIPRNIAYKLAAQAVLGSARMVLETGKHPGVLKDEVCSPAGSTIEAVAALEKHGFRYAVMDAMNECTRRAREISSMYD